MNREFIYNYILQCKLAVISTATPGHKPEAALIGIAVTKNLEIIFDTIKTSRKYFNLSQNLFVALVIGWDDEITLQYEGSAVELTGREGEPLKDIYFESYPDGRKRAETWPDIVYFKITPTWIRYSNLNEPVIIEEMKF